MCDLTLPWPAKRVREDSCKDEPQHRRRRYTGWPRQPGQRNFDLKDGFRETLYQNTVKCDSKTSEADKASAMQFTREELIEMNTDQHANLVEGELNDIQHIYACSYDRIHFYSRDRQCTPNAEYIQPTAFSTDTFRNTSIDSLSTWSQSSEVTNTPNMEPCLTHYDPDSQIEHVPDMPDGKSPSTGLLKSLEPRAINVSQLIQEVKGIYAGLVMVEKKCIEIVTQQASNPTELSREQWQALIALHRTLLNEHHDFFSATSRPSAPYELQQLAAKYAVPARMWRHGLHPLLNLIQKQIVDHPETMKEVMRATFGVLNRWKIDIPGMEAEWVDIALGLHRYVALLRSLGINLLETYEEVLSRRLFACEEVVSEWVNSMTYNLQYEDPSDSCCTYVGQPSATYFESYFQSSESNNCLWALLAGWYQLGGYISPDLRRFLKIFAFIPWAVVPLWMG